MANKLFDPRHGKSFNQGFRAKRFDFFKSLLQKIDRGDPIKILDVGGTQIYWERMNFSGHDNVFITLLNLDLAPVSDANFSSIKGNACDLSEFEDNHFDIVYSNSVIEHLFTLENQQKMADEVRRVGKNYFIQSPNFYFPIEPHWLFPLFQFFPFGMRVWLTRNFNLGHYAKSASNADAVLRVKEVQLLTEKQMRSLFPEGDVYREHFLGLKKSITMYYFKSEINGR
jgi:Methyltransferase domain